MLLIWCLLLVGQGFIAQEPAHKQFTVRDGLQSNSIYSLFQDSRGFLWVGTDKGVMRYNGEIFEEIMHQRKYPLLEVYRIIEDEHGVIWFSSRECKLYKYQSQEVHAYEFSHVLDSIRPERSLYVTDFGVMGDGEVHLTMNGRPSYIIDAQGVADSSTVSNFSFERASDNQWLLKMPRLATCKLAGKYKATRPDSNLPFHFYLPEDAGSCDIRTIPDSNDPVFCIGEMVYRVTRDKCLFFRANGPIASLDCDHKGNIWLGLVNGGLQLLNPQLEAMPGGFSFLENVTVSSIAFDSFNQMWIGTSSRGLFKINNSRIMHYAPPSDSDNNEVVDIALHDSTVFVAFAGGLFISHDLKSSLVTQYDFTEDHKGVMVQSMVFDTSLNRIVYLTLGGSELFMIDEKGSRAAIPAEHPYLGRRMKNVDGQVLCFAGGGLHRLVELAGNQLLPIISLDKVETNRRGLENFLIQDVEDLGNGNYLLASGIGLYEFIDQELIESSEKYGVEARQKVERILKIEGGFLFANSEDGVFGRLGDQIVKISSAQGLMSDYILSLAQDGEFLYIGTNDGLHTIRTVDLKLEEPPILHSHWGEKIRVLKCGLGCLWTGTSSGLTRTPLEEFHTKKSPPKIEMISCDIGDRHSMSVEDGVIVLPNNVENLDFYFEVVDISQHGPFNVEYVVPEIGDHWKQSSSGLLQFAGIGFGDYTLQVRARRNGGAYSELRTVPFAVKSPIFLRWWFILIVLVLVVGSIIVFLQLARLGERRKLARKNKMAMLTQQALSARMDPHFIFNSLNSLKYFIKIQDLESASKYLNDFAKLMRSNIEYVKDDMIELKQEIELLRNYCSLENMRLENCADFEIVVDPDVDMHLRIPSMILQPVVENAIWHGLGSKVGQKRLSITVKMDKGEVVFDVVDNGIGRKAAAAMNPSRQRKATKHSLEFIIERLRLFSQIHNRSFRLSFEDRHDWYGQAIGTRCELRFPKLKGGSVVYNDVIAKAG